METTKKKSNWDRIKHKHTGSSERGNSEQWKSTFNESLYGIKPSTENQDLILLGLDKMPKTIKALKKARNLAMLKNHPDRGGTDQQAQAINKAYENILSKMPL